MENESSCWKLQARIWWYSSEASYGRGHMPIWQDSPRAGDSHAEYVPARPHRHNHRLIAISWLDGNKINHINWPSFSPDLNPIEHLWDEVERRMKKTYSRHVAELEQCLMRIWKSIESQVLHRFTAVICRIKENASPMIDEGYLLKMKNALEGLSSLTSSNGVLYVKTLTGKTIEI